MYLSNIYRSICSYERRPFGFSR